MKIVSKIVATFFGLGFSPLAPGTAASLAVLFLYKYFLTGLPWPGLVLIFVCLLAAGVWSSFAYSAEVGKEDPPAVVIDEVAGQLLVFLTVPATWLNLGLAFALFRFFDIVKPYPIHKAEKLPGGWGIMADDVAAGAAAGVVLNLYLLLK
jgi:phosphatidylglycerophosphatase A